MRTSKRFDRDVMNMASPTMVARASMATLTGLQDHTPEIQLMGIAACFLSLAEFHDIPAQDIFTATKNLINGDDGKRVEFSAIDAYLDGELA